MTTAKLQIDNDPDPDHNLWWNVLIYILAFCVGMYLLIEYFN